MAKKRNECEDEGSSFPRTVAALKAAVEDAADGRTGTLRCYKSSVEVERYFCGTCSSSVFYAVHSRPDIVDLSPGVLQVPGGGALSESRLAWSFSKIHWKQDTAGGWRHGLLDAVEASEDWVQRRRVEEKVAKSS